MSESIYCNCCGNEIYPGTKFCSDECQEEMEYRYSLEECVEFVRNKSQNWVYDDVIIYAKLLHKFCLDNQEPLSRGWLKIGTTLGDIETGDAK